MDVDRPLVVDSSHDAADQDLAQLLHALVAQMMTEAQEADADGDFCCALTQRNDAIAVLSVIAEWRSTGHPGARQNPPVQTMWRGSSPA